ncbi:hypothetical protein T07_9655 [Trichinella nelsoni]|uniref:Uncharacterized protein n=1 Tax=Trichinella nelsoni TaxID=6336 RepID=A0A0V0SJF2_9BILA|nr:hypothetical protein T07_9655 [Trichinella nelsoni]
MQNILLPISHLSYSFTDLQECIAFGVIALCQLHIYYLVQLPYTLIYYIFLTKIGCIPPRVLSDF